MTDMIDGHDIERMVHAQNADERLETVQRLSAGLDRAMLTPAARDQMVSILRRFVDDKEEAVREAIPDEIAGGSRAARRRVLVDAAE